MDDFQESLPIVICLLSFLIVVGILALSVAGVINMLEDPGLRLAWWVNAGVFLFSSIILAIQARRGRGGEWRLPLEMGSSPTSRGVSPMESKPSQPSEFRGPEMSRDNLIEKTPRFQPSEPSPTRETGWELTDLEDVEVFGAHTLEQARLETLEQPTLEQEALEEPILEQKQETLEPAKEDLRRLKKALDLNKGFLNYKRRGRVSTMSLMTKPQRSIGGTV